MLEAFRVRRTSNLYGTTSVEFDIPLRLPWRRGANVLRFAGQRKGVEMR
jgi:hypothetical protein